MTEVCWGGIRLLVNRGRGNKKRQQGTTLNTPTPLKRQEEYGVRGSVLFHNSHDWNGWTMGGDTPKSRTKWGPKSTLGTGQIQPHAGGTIKCPFLFLFELLPGGVQEV